MQLHMTMEQGEARIISDKIDFYFLETAEHDDVFHDAGGMFAGDLGYFKAVSVQVHGVDVVGGVAHMEAVSLALFQLEHRRHVHHVEGDAIDGPAVEAFVGGLLFGKDHFDDFVGLGC